MTTKNEIKEFVDYCYKFYGKGGMYSFKMTKKELRRATEKLISQSGYDFAGDSFDREKVRDIVLNERRLLLSSLTGWALTTRGEKEGQK